MPCIDAGEPVLEATVAQARDVWGERLVAAYALGSLAHGGFSIHVSDADVALVLRDPLQPDDASGADRLLSLVKEANTPLADRLSLFWGSPETLAGRTSGGRFPPADRQDLKDFGRLLAGRDLRSQLVRPSFNELIADGAELALEKLSHLAVIAKLKEPRALAACGATKLTKWLLFPVRLIFTARTGNVGGVDLAVEHFCGTTGGPAAELARAALGWRHAPPEAHDQQVIALIERGLLPLYTRFFDEYEPRLRIIERADLAEAFRHWRHRMKECDS